MLDILVERPAKPATTTPVKPSAERPRTPPLTRRTFLTTALLTPLPAAGHLRIVHTQGEKISFLAGGRLLFDYRYSNSRPKTYVHPFCAPDGSPLTIDGPPDHVHHRGLMLAWSGVNGYDFWGEVNPAPHGRIVHQRLERLRQEPPVEITVIEHWVAEGRLLLVERRTIRALNLSAGEVWLEWISELAPHREPVVLSAEKHVYNGLGIRFKRSWAGGNVLNARGTHRIAQVNGQPAEWCAYYGKLDRGELAGVAIFDYPDNPRHPTPFFVMNEPFGYLSAAPTFQKPFRLEPGETLPLRYAVVGFLGRPELARVQALYERWRA